MADLLPDVLARDELYHQARPDQETLIRQSVKRPPQPTAFGGLKTGPDLSIEYRDNQTFPVEMSNPMLRNLSPFMIQVEPPLVYGEAGGFLNQQTGQLKVDTYNAAQRQTSGYDSARQALYRSNLTYVGMDGGMGDTKQFIQQMDGQTKPQTVESKTGVRMGLPAIADINTAVDIARQLSTILHTPPLVLLINPATLQIAYTKIQQFSDRTRFGFKYHAWGEEQVKLSINAKCGAFVSAERGVQYASKNDSAAWQNLMGAFHLYRNNGYIYDTIGKSNAHHFVGALSIHYDGWVYYGHMESLSWTFEETTQHGGIEFSMEFTASQMVDTAQSSFAVAPMRSPTFSPSDPRYQGMTFPSQRPGEISIGFNSDGTPRLSTQGMAIGGTDVYHMMTPGGTGQPAGLVQGMPRQPVGDQGFTAPYVAPTPGQREVNMAVPNRVIPFRGGR